MAKKILMALAAVLVVAGGVAALSAYEAHVINVTAHIENALSVSTKEIAFGTVFPQEMVEEDFTIRLSGSFLDEPRVDDVRYVIEQKPKCWNDKPADPIYGLAKKDAAGTWICADAGFVIMPDLCQFLSKLPQDGDGNDYGVESYYQGSSCTSEEGQASGYLGKLWDIAAGGDLSDTWTVDLKVPPVAGYVGQDWPEGCPTVPFDGVDYGCDLWIEVTGISETPI